jgi:hypothetical protein
MRSVEELIPYARNARTHSDEQVAQIAGSIREFGFTNPLLLDGDNSILAGHGRVLAARKLGMTEIPCIELAQRTPGDLGWIDEAGYLHWPKRPKASPTPTRFPTRRCIRSRSRAICGCWGGIGCSAATAPWRPTSSACPGTHG